MAEARDDETHSRLGSGVNCSVMRHRSTHRTVASPEVVYEFPLLEGVAS
jgi:hypothetical protein